MIPMPQWNLREFMSLMRMLDCACGLLMHGFKTLSNSLILRGRFYLKFLKKRSIFKHIQKQNTFFKLNFRDVVIVHC